jgi:hypothetical protein
MPKATTADEKLDKVIDLLQHILAVELAREGVPRNSIAKHIGVANARAGQMLKGVGKAGKDS